jgi:N-acetylmuramoyl-L-alanine amidase
MGSQTLTAGTKYVTVKPKLGEGTSVLLNRYKLPADKENISLFKELNPKKFDKKGGLLKGQTYKLPIKIVQFNGKSIRSSVDGISKDVAQKIEDINRKFLEAGLTEKSYKKSKLLWVPVYLLSNDSDKPSRKDDSDSTDVAPIPRKRPIVKDNNNKSTTTDVKKKRDDSKDDKRKSSDSKKKSNGVPYLGEKYKKIDKIDNSLEDCVYYLDPGHGGPDPGAIGHNGKYTLCEDEYAYDVVLRLARCLLQHGATVYVLVHDDNDGIRDDQFLSNNDTEYYLGGGAISENQKERLMARANIVNDLYEKHKKTAKLQQLIVIHLDSRVVKQRVDIFYYYKPGSNEGKALAESVYNFIKTKYDASQPGRGYKSTVTARNLLMLRETKPTGLYVELGNIQNKRNQIRFIEKNNRQAIANWFCEALIKCSKKF